MSSKTKPKKSRISKLIEKSDSETDDGEHELSHYMNDRVKLMKEVLKIIKPKKIKTMVPNCIKSLNIEEVNSMLLEELLGISNKRLKYIFAGQPLEEDSSSTDPEEEKQLETIDIVSLDDVSDDDFIINLDSDNPRKKKHSKQKDPKKKRIKVEKQEKNKGLQEENLMSVLELLELQARARAIRSQLSLEASKRTRIEIEKDLKHTESDNDEVIIESPKNDEIIITSSDSETESKQETTVKTKIIVLDRNRFKDTKNENEESTVKIDDDQGIILIVDQDEIDALAD